MLSCFGHVQLFVTPWTVACQAPLSMGFSRQEYWSGLPCPCSGHLPDPRIESMSLKSPALAGEFFTTSATWEAEYISSSLQLLSWIRALSYRPWTHTCCPRKPAKLASSSQGHHWVTGVQAEFLIKSGKGLKVLSLHVVVIYFFILKHFPKIPQSEHCTLWKINILHININNCKRHF